MMAWLILTYKVPAEPAKRRIALWRKLKGMGAVYLQSGVCVVPKTEEHLRSLKILENDIAEMNGNAVLFEAVGMNSFEEAKIVARFDADRDEDYRELLDKCSDFEAEIRKETAAEHFTFAELVENDEDLKKLQGWFAKIQQLDFHGAPLAAEVRDRIVGCEALLETYAQRVYEAHEENRTTSPHREETAS